MQVKAKFNCHYVQEGTGSKIAHLSAVYGTEGENADFAKATPGGNLNMTIDNGTPASEFFEQGGTYYLTFEKA